MGSTPSVSANANGDVVMAYRTSTGEINFWAGTATEGESAVSWLRKGTLAVSDIDLAEPAIQINDDRWVVAVYRFGPRPDPGRHGLMLASKAGHLQDGRINWGKLQVLGDGRMPSLKIDGDDVELIYQNADGAGRRLMTGVISVGSSSISSPRTGWTGRTARSVPR